MIDKKDDDFSTNTDLKSPSQAAAILAQSRQLLETNTASVHSEIRSSFARLAEALRSREKQLLRQVDALQSQQLALLQSHESVLLERSIGDMPKPPMQVKADLKEEEALLNAIQSFGKVSVNRGTIIIMDSTEASYSTPYRLEDYQDANEDHMSSYKSLSESTAEQEVIRFGFTPRTSLNLCHMPSKGADARVTVEDMNSNNQNEDCAENATERRPSQVEHWLQQIKVETEIEPSVAEQDKNLEH
ncbi:uncharacterized protein LOC126203687 [Schistocerca nitens]|uniref:uncharacterized protein LOC126203687 n=1 Tax=Schistocerca nitens TaxID=7011 RepID=UPI002117338F|nr:uncharacterized protein LOC126203687 [Schistocerca nitens]